MWGLQNNPSCGRQARLDTSGRCAKSSQTNTINRNEASSIENGLALARRSASPPRDPLKFVAEPCVHASSHQLASIWILAAHALCTSSKQTKANEESQSKPIAYPFIYFACTFIDWTNQIKPASFISPLLLLLPCGRTPAPAPQSHSAPPAPPPPGGALPPPGAAR